MGAWDIAQTAEIFLGLCMIGTVIGAIIWVLVREDKGRPILPWGERMRVEKAHAHTEVLKSQLEQDGLEVKRIGLDHHRNLVMRALEQGDDEMVAHLTLGKPKPKLERGDEEVVGQVVNDVWENRS
jgi:hypothetical protein